MLARAMRERAGESCPVLVALTGYGDEQMRVNVKAAGFATLNVGYASRSRPIEALAEDIERFAESLDGSVPQTARWQGVGREHQARRHGRSYRYGDVAPMAGTEWACDRADDCVPA